MISNRLGGALFIAGSAIGFGAMAIFGKVAFGSGASTTTVLFFRFLAAGTLMVLLMGSMRQQWPRGRDLAVLVLMGGLGYAGQAFCFFSALRHATAGLTGLLLYLYPALVLIGSAILGRRKLTLAKVLLALLALFGIMLTVTGGLAGTPTGIAFGVGAAFVYTVYILVGEGVTGRTGAVGAGSVIMLSAAAVFGTATVLEGPSYPATAEGWLAMAAIAVVSTLMPIVFFFAGMRRLGASDASTLSTLEPVVTLLLAYFFLGEKLGLLQALGSGLVIAAVVVLTRLR